MADDNKKKPGIIRKAAAKVAGAALAGTGLGQYASDKISGNLGRNPAGITRRVTGKAVEIGLSGLGSTVSQHFSQKITDRPRKRVPGTSGKKATANTPLGDIPEFQEYATKVADDINSVRSDMEQGMNYLVNELHRQDKKIDAIRRDVKRRPDDSGDRLKRSIQPRDDKGRFIKADDDSPRSSVSKTKASPGLNLSDMIDKVMNTVKSGGKIAGGAAASRLLLGAGGTAVVGGILGAAVGSNMLLDHYNIANQKGATIDERKARAARRQKEYDGDTTEKTQATADGDKVEIDVKNDINLTTTNDINLKAKEINLDANKINFKTTQLLINGQPFSEGGSGGSGYQPMSTPSPSRSYLEQVRYDENVAKYGATKAGEIEDTQKNPIGGSMRSLARAAGVKSDWAQPAANRGSGAPVETDGERAGLNKNSKLQDAQGNHTKSTLGINGRQWNAFREGLAGIESRGGEYGLTGGSSGRFSGAYQFGAAEIAQTAKQLGEDPPSREQFLKDPQMQERYLDRYTKDHHDYLMKKSPQYQQMDAEQRLGVLGYAHNQGAGGAAKWLATGQAGADAFGTSGTKYTSAIASQLARTKEDQSTVQTVSSSSSYKIDQKKMIDAIKANHSLAKFASDETIMKGFSDKIAENGLKIENGKIVGDSKKIDEMIGGLKQQFPNTAIDDVVSKEEGRPEAAQVVKASLGGVQNNPIATKVSPEVQNSRPSRFGGQVDLEGAKYTFGTGGTGLGSIPYGSHPIGKFDTGQERAAMGRSYTKDAFNLPMAIKDSKIGSTQGGNRLGILIHGSSGKTLDDIYTAGCLGISREQWPEFKKKLQEYQKKNGNIVLDVGPNGARIRPASDVPASQTTRDPQQFIQNEGGKQAPIASDGFLPFQGKEPTSLDQQGINTASPIRPTGSIPGFGSDDGVKVDATKVAEKVIANDMPGYDQMGNPTGQMVDIEKENKVVQEAQVPVPDTTIKSGEEVTAGIRKDQGLDGPAKKESAPAPTGSGSNVPGSLRSPTNHPESENPTPGSDGYGDCVSNPDGAGVCAI